MRSTSRSSPSRRAWSARSRPATSTCSTSLPSIGVEQSRSNDEITVVEVAGHELARVGDELRPAAVGQPAARMAVAKAIDRRDLIDDGLLRTRPTGGRRDRAGLRVRLSAAGPGAEPAGVRPGGGEGGGRGGRGRRSRSRPDVAEGQHRARRSDPQPDAGHRARHADRALQQAAWNERWHGRGLRLDHHRQRRRRRSGRRALELLPLRRPVEQPRLQQPEVDRDARSDADDRRPGGARQSLPADPGDAARTSPTPSSTTRPDIAAFSNYVKGYMAIPEMRYLETVWLDR